MSHRLISGALRKLAWIGAAENGAAKAKDTIPAAPIHASLRKAPLMRRWLICSS